MDMVRGLGILKLLRLYPMFLSCGNSFLKLFAQAKTVSIDIPFCVDPGDWPRSSLVSLESCFTTEAFYQSTWTSFFITSSTLWQTLMWSLLHKFMYSLYVLQITFEYMQFCFCFQVSPILHVLICHFFMPDSYSIVWMSSILFTYLQWIIIWIFVLFN